MRFNHDRLVRQEKQDRFVHAEIVIASNRRYIVIASDRRERSNLFLSVL